MGFKCGRDSTVFTSWGILDVDVKGLSGKRVEFQLVPYEAIRHFSVESAGRFDADSELELILCTPWLPSIKRDFRAGQVDIVAVQNTIAAKILGEQKIKIYVLSNYPVIIYSSCSCFGIGPPGRPSDFGTENSVVGIADPSTFSQILSYIEEKNLKIDPQPLEEKFKGELPLLQMDETVELAFKCGRDMFLITTKRVVVVDVQGINIKIYFRAPRPMLRYMPRHVVAVGKV